MWYGIYDCCLFFLFNGVFFFHFFLHLIFFSFQPLCTALDVLVLNAKKHYEQ